MPTAKARTCGQEVQLEKTYSKLSAYVHQAKGLKSRDFNSLASRGCYSFCQRTNRGRSKKAHMKEGKRGVVGGGAPFFFFLQRPEANWCARRAGGATEAAAAKGIE